MVGENYKKVRDAFTLREEIEEEEGDSEEFEEEEISDESDEIE